MTKKAKKKARTRDDKDEQDERPDDGTEVYDESDDEEDWVEDEKAASAPVTAEVADYAGMTEEETREMPEAATTEAPPDPKDQPPVPKDYDVLINDPPFQPADEPEAQEKYTEPPAPQSPLLPGEGETQELQTKKKER